MITVTQTRDKDGEHYKQPTLTFDDPFEAVVHMAKVELGWGGQIVEIDESHIKVQTRVLACIDISIFEGPVEEMKPLFELVYFYLEASQKYGDLIVDQTVDYTSSLPDGVVGNRPLFFTMLAPLLMGGNRLKVAVMLACGLQDEVDIKAGLEANIEDLVAAAQLAQQEGCSFREALA